MNLLDIKILKYIKKKRCVKNTVFEKKFGPAYHVALESLEKGGYIESPPFHDGVQFGFTTGDDWKITDTGLYFLLNYKAEQQLTIRQKIFNFVLGFVSGVATGVVAQIVIDLIFPL